jgi:hypothetical protein
MTTHTHSPPFTEKCICTLLHLKLDYIFKWIFLQSSPWLYLLLVHVTFTSLHFKFPLTENREACFFFLWHLLEKMGVVTLGELKPSVSGRRTFRPSSSIRHATEWYNNLLLLLKMFYSIFYNFIFFFTWKQIPDTRHDTDNIILENGILNVIVSVDIM